jgi:hypothetical protein
VNIPLTHLGSYECQDILYFHVRVDFLLEDIIFSDDSELHVGMYVCVREWLNRKGDAPLPPPHSTGHG